MFRMFKLPPLYSLLALSWFVVPAFVVQTAVIAQDWGYDDGSTASPRALPAQPGKLPSQAPGKQPAQAAKLPVSTTKVKSPAAAKGAAKSTTHVTGKPGSDRLTAASSVAQSWVELFELVACQPLTNDQKNRYAATIEHLTHGPLREELVAIQSFWPAIAPRIRESAEFRESFKSLFKSLLRMQERAKALDSERSEVIAEVLGPERVADLGPPPLTEDAVDAYADMACFLYEQKNPGKTIDATDNRAVFASVVLNKFKDAPTEADKRSMVNFAVTWARFRIIYAEASDAEKARLLGELEKKGAATVAGLSNPTVDHILRNGPWSKLIGRPKTES